MNKKKKSKNAYIVHRGRIYNILKLDVTVDEENLRDC